MGVQHSAIPLDCYSHKGEDRGKRADPAYVPAREQLAEDVSHFPSGWLRVGVTMNGIPMNIATTMSAVAKFIRR